ENRLAILEKICAELGCVSVAHFGKILTLFRPESHHGHFLAAAKPALERSRRDPKEDYTPKKLAAAGKSIKDKKHKSAAPKGNDELAKPRKKPAIPVRKASGQIARPSTRSARPAVRRTGSALTLRAGRRK
ncbi:MAG: ribosome assembly RNA-binding protein YhbY, partial [Pelistega sp.]|nr:ribosome assembly RNA-binding protein YhbY [Pelistega sp.]